MSQMPPSRYAVVRAGNTENIILWDGLSAYPPPEGCELIPAGDAPPMEADAPASAARNSETSDELALLMADWMSAKSPPEFDPPAEAAPEVAPELATELDAAPASDNANGDVFSGEEDISDLQTVAAERDEAREALAIALEEITALKAREPEVRTVEKIVERVVEVSSPEAAPLRIIPEEIAAMMEPDETFSPEVRRKLTERLNVELAELKNLRGLAGEDLKREAEIEKLLGLFARLGEI